MSVAEKFLDVPYYWGGKTAQGLDCSGLVQTSLEVCGISSPRDTDMQEMQLGKKLMVNDLDGLRRGDLVFWKGHVGIMTDQKTLLHANGHHMMTVKEPLVEAVARIADPSHQHQALLVTALDVHEIEQGQSRLVPFDLRSHIGADHLRIRSPPQCAV